MTIHTLLRGRYVPRRFALDDYIIVATTANTQNDRMVHPDDRNPRAHTMTALTFVGRIDMIIRFALVVGSAVTRVTLRRYSCVRK
jgi:hypothetical protein